MFWRADKFVSKMLAKFYPQIGYKKTASGMRSCVFINLGSAGTGLAFWYLSNRIRTRLIPRPYLFASEVIMEANMQHKCIKCVLLMESSSQCFGNWDIHHNS
jgi:hypothetical protein